MSLVILILLLKLKMNTEANPKFVIACFRDRIVD